MSVLKHGGGSSDAISSAISSRNKHHEDTHGDLFAGTHDLVEVDRRHMHVDEEVPTQEVEGEVDGDFPRHVHSTTVHGSHFVASDIDHHQTLLESGDWSDTPLQVDKEGNVIITLQTEPDNHEVSEEDEEIQTISSSVKGRKKR